LKVSRVDSPCQGASVRWLARLARALDKRTTPEGERCIRKEKDMSEEEFSELMHKNYSGLDRDLVENLSIWLHTGGKREDFLVFVGIEW
jgi:hypothetical protein